jgi:hypothetical protein
MLSSIWFAWGQERPAATAPNPVVEVLVKKGILTPAEAKQIEQAATEQLANERIARILLDKGVISKAEFEQIAGKAPDAAAAAPEQKMASSQPPVAAIASQAQAAQKAPAIVAAIAPIRALPVGGVSREAINLAFKTNGVGITPYGFVKATAAEDSSSPDGDDFPLPGFIADSGPDGAPEFHVKARATRLGMQFAWFDPSPKWAITGKVEVDFEGNFNRSDNRNISSVRSSNPSLRLAFGRLDYNANSRNTLSALFGQDWTPFGSSTLPNMLETTGCGIGFGALWERTPQMRVGFTHKFSAMQIMPEFAITLPAEGVTPSAAFISQQLGYGERQGPDSNRPDVEGRLVAQWQLDHAAGVAPAQLIVSGEQGKRTAIVLAAAVPAAYKGTFAAGATGSSHSNGWDAEAQLPTRYATLTGKFYSGADLRYFFGGQLYSYFNDVAGLTNTATVASEDGSSNIVFGTNGDGLQVIAPERPLRTQGGFAQLGLPLSRLLKARAGSRNAGWTLYAMYGIDQAKTRDLNRLGASGTRRYSTMAVGTLNYSLDKWISFSAEQSLYTTHANPDQPLPLFKGVASREWNDIRTEFGPVFSF